MKLKKIASMVLAVVTVAAITTSFASCNNKNDDVFVVGICQQQTHDALDAATLAVSVHGRAGRVAACELSVHAVMPEDIICKIGSVLLDLEAEDNS